MLTFLRRIRKGLLSDGAIPKYLLYAIGEIALVVIGILIALQINNWNEERKDRSKEQWIIQNIYDELNENYLYLDGYSVQLESAIKNAKSLLEVTGPEPQYLSQDSFTKLLGQVNFIVPYSPIDAQYRQLVTGENLDLIQFDSLKQLIATMDQTMVVTKDIFDSGASARGNLMQYMNEYGVSLDYIVRYNHTDEVRDVKKSRFVQHVNLILSDPKFENRIGPILSQYSWHLLLITFYKRDIETVIDYIERHYKIE